MRHREATAASPSRASAWLLALLLAASIASPVRGAPVAVVAAERVYGDLVERIGGDEVAVVSVLASPDQDPHAFEASASTAARIAQARLVVYNGAGYDAWIARLLEGAPSSKRAVIDVARLAGHAAGDNPHVWYDVDAVEALARALADRLSHLDPAHGAGYAERLSRFEAALRPLRDRIAALRARYAGTPIAATEPVFGYMSDALGLTTHNARFQLAIMNGTEPSARDMAAFERDLRTRAVKALIVNRQTTTALTRRMRALATDSGVPVVEVTETQPPGLDYTQWMLSQLDDLERALAAR
jgi:zinc/manganese transport system substrate-binding protein